MRKGLIIVALLGAAVAVLGLLGLGVWIWHIDSTWSPILEPRIRERQQISSIRVMAHDAQGNPKWIGSITAGRLEERQPVKLSEVPPQLVQAVIALEDPRFLRHGGFDVLGILRALVKDVATLRFSQGGSTITQQLVKNVFLTSKKTLSRKLTELVLAALLEKRFSKDEILEAYINEVYLGQMGPIEIHGVARASEFYFGKKIDQLEIDEMALLAAMINSPGLYSPWKHPEPTRKRRDRALRALADAKLILPEELETFLQRPLPGPSKLVATTRAAYLMDALREKLLAERGEMEVLKGGFEINLGLDIELQETAEKALHEKSAQWDPFQQAILVAADPRSCEVRAYMGGTNYRLTQLDRIRQSKRPIGSLMKPLEMSRLLEDDPQGLNLATVFDDQPLTWSYDNGRGSWEPANYDNKFRGPVTVRQALEESLNVPIARVFFERVPNGDLNEIFDPIRALGLEVPPERALPSAVLGAIDQSPWHVLQAYVKLTRQALGLTDDAGDFACHLNLESKGPPTAPAPASVAPAPAHFGQKGARLVVAALEGAVRRGTSKVLGARLPTNQAWAGKTGTSSDSRDAWYAALSPDLVVIGWVGRDDNQVTKFTGATGAMPIVAELVEAWAKRPEHATGFKWPLPTELAWRAVSLEKRCRVADVQQVLLHSAHPDPSQTGLPPEPFEHEGQKYVYELFRDGALPAECP